MSMQDVVADMLTRIRNAQHVGKKNVTMPSSKLKVAIAKVLQDEGYIVGYETHTQGVKTELVIDLKYHLGKPVIVRISRVSSPGWRRYVSCADLPKVLGGLGIAIVSTPKGVVSAEVARSMGQGGEVICYVA
jgi:small subunit ribosomal protein S8